MTGVNSIEEQWVCCFYEATSKLLEPQYRIVCRRYAKSTKPFVQ